MMALATSTSRSSCSASRAMALYRRSATSACLQSQSDIQITQVITVVPTHTQTLSRFSSASHLSRKGISGNLWRWLEWCFVQARYLHGNKWTGSEHCRSQMEPDLNFDPWPNPEVFDLVTQLRGLWSGDPTQRSLIWWPNSEVFDLVIRPGEFDRCNVSANSSKLHVPNLQKTQWPMTRHNDPWPDTNC